MPRSLLLALGAGLLLAALLLWRFATAGDAPDTTPDSAPTVATDAAPQVSDAGTPTTTSTRETVASAPPAPAPALPRVQPAGRDRADLVGQVVDDLGLPVAGATVTAQSSLGSTPDRHQLDDDRDVAATVQADEAGRFRLAALATGPYLLRGHSGDGRRGALRVAVIKDAAPPVRLELQPARGRIAVQVVDAVGRPTAGVVVTFFLAVPRTDAARIAPAPTVTTDAQGLALLALPCTASGAAVVLDHQGTCGAAWIDERRTATRLVLGPGGLVGGTLRGVDAAELVGTAILATRAQSSEHAGTVHLHAVPGRITGVRYQFPPLPPGSYVLTLRSPRGLALGAPAEPGARDPYLTLSAGQALEHDVEVVAGGTIAGQATDDQGRGVGGVRIDVQRRGEGFDPFGWTTPEGTPIQRFDTVPWTGHDDPRRDASAHGDPSGHFVCAGLRPGVYAVTVTAPGRTSLQRTTVNVAAGRTTRLDARLLPAGALELWVEGGEHIGLMPSGAPQPVVAFVAPADGLCTVPHLLPGLYRVHTLGRDRLLLGEVQVRAGVTTWADLRHGGPVRIEGRLRAAGAPLADAAIRMPWARAMSDAEGRFVLHLPAPWPADDSWRLEVRHEGSTWQVRPPAELVGREQWRGVLELGDATLPVLIQDADGRAADATLTVEAPLAAGAVQFRGACRTVAGAAVVRGLPAGGCRVQARFADGATATAECTLPASGTLLLRAPQSGAVRVRLLDVQGQPLPGQTVGVLAGIPDQGHGQHIATTDEHGTALLTGLPAQELTVGVFHWMTSGGEAERDPQPVPVAVRHAVVSELELQMRR